jgi:hypothetical protein
MPVWNDEVNVPIKRNHVYVEQYRIDCETDENTKLWLAVLKLAIHDLFKEHYREQSLLWFTSKKTHVGSFRFICDIFGVNRSVFLSNLKSFVLSKQLLNQQMDLFDHYLKIKDK